MFLLLLLRHLSKTLGETMTMMKYYMHTVTSMMGCTMTLRG